MIRFFEDGWLLFDDSIVEFYFAHGDDECNVLFGVCIGIIFNLSFDRGESAVAEP